MKLKAISRQAEEIQWPKDSNHLPVLTWDDFEAECKTRQLMVIGGFIHDVSTFIDEHPGGRALIKTRLGRDATTAFYGGVYDHSNGASNVLSRYRVAGAMVGWFAVSGERHRLVDLFLISPNPRASWLPAVTALASPPNRLSVEAIYGDSRRREGKERYETLPPISALAIGLQPVSGAHRHYPLYSWSAICWLALRRANETAEDRAFLRSPRRLQRRKEVSSVSRQQTPRFDSFVQGYW